MSIAVTHLGEDLQLAPAQGLKGCSTSGTASTHDIDGWPNVQENRNSLLCGPPCLYASAFFVRTIPSPPTKRSRKILLIKYTRQDGRAVYGV